MTKNSRGTKAVVRLENSRMISLYSNILIIMFIISRLHIKLAEIDSVDKQDSYDNYKIHSLKTREVES